jgi:N-hydroxyarylamine O-acetyltransferase
MPVHEPDGLNPALRDRVLDRLGLPAAPFADVEGLGEVYAAWCLGMPFDNVRKMTALRTAPAGEPLPGGRADDFFGAWLAHGAGGTCWPSSNALFALLRSLGFDAHRITAAMHDIGLLNHASVRVSVGARHWVVDSSSLTAVPLPLGDEVFVHDDPVFHVEVEPMDGTHLVWTSTPPNTGFVPCRLQVVPVAHGDYLAGYERSRERSPFNQRLYARRNRPGELLVVVGHTRFSRTRAGLESRRLSPEEVCDCLRSDIGLSGALVEQWVRAGGLEASFEPASGPTPPRPARLPPSRRPVRRAL